MTITPFTFCSPSMAERSWVTARVDRAAKDGVSVFTFKPLEKAENSRADNLPGVTYRRTLKVRLVLPADKVQVYG